MDVQDFYFSPSPRLQCKEVKFVCVYLFTPCGVDVEGVSISTTSSVEYRVYPSIVNSVDGHPSTPLRVSLSSPQPVVQCGRAEGIHLHR